MRHPKPKKTTVTESIRVLIEQNDGKPVKLGDFEMQAVPSSGGPDSPPFYFVGQHKEVTGLWICHCRDFRFRSTPEHDCDHVKRAKGES